MNLLFESLISLLIAKLIELLTPDSKIGQNTFLQFMCYILCRQGAVSILAEYTILVDIAKNATKIEHSASRCNGRMRQN